MRGSSRPDWRTGKRRYLVHFSTGDARDALGTTSSSTLARSIESGTYEVWRVEQPREAEGLGHAWAKLVAV